MRWLRQLFAWLCAGVLLAWRLTCRYRVENDPRPRLRAEERPYVYALLHAHQVAAVFCNDEERMAAMVSRSADGDLLVPSLQLRRVIPVRGSTRKHGKDKGGSAALQELTSLAAQRIPVLLAVDGPRGPRNHVHRGVITLARDAHAVILPTLVLPSRRWFLARTWDRFQLPKPFATVRLIFGHPIEPQPDESDETLRTRVREALGALEVIHDPKEAALAQAAAHARAAISPP